MESLIRLENGSVARVNVYRDDAGQVVIVGAARHETPAGTSETIVQTRMSPAVFEHYRQAAIERLGPVLYQRLLARSGLSDDVSKAPLLPSALPPLPKTGRLFSR